MVPHRTPFFLPWFFPSSLLWRVETSEKEMYLTFDDGPVNGPTEFVLEALSVHSAKATFFCIGDNVRKHPEVFQKIIDGGHAVGNHTFNHFNGWSKQTEDYVANINQCEATFDNFQFKRHSVPLFRPPYGRIKRSQINALKNYRIVMWDVLSIDYDVRVSPEKCLTNTIRACRPGSVVVFHDSFKAERNMSFALPRFLEHFLSQGYQFKTL